MGRNKIFLLTHGYNIVLKFQYLFHRKKEVIFLVKAMTRALFFKHPPLVQPMSARLKGWQVSLREPQAPVIHHHLPDLCGVFFAQGTFNFNIDPTETKTKQFQMKPD